MVNTVCVVNGCKKKAYPGCGIPFHRYGLLLPEKAKLSRPKFQASRNVFGNDSESDDDSSKKSLLLRPSDNVNRQAKITQSKAIEEDPTIYQYDEIYDSMTSKKEEKKLKAKESKQPKYIESLLKTASKRKIENERRVERQIQKEREKEGDEFADKEVFVTSAYKKKLEDLRLEEEKEQREEYLEKIGDVTKQRDLGGFYRHLYEQKLGSDKHSAKEQKSKDTEVEVFKNRKDKKGDNNSETSKKRSYRKRKASADNDALSEGEIEDSDEEINRVNLVEIRSFKKIKQNEENLDADSDFSIDSSSDDDTSSKKKGKKERKKEEMVKPETKSKTEIPQQEPSKEPDPSKVKPLDHKVETLPEPKPKINIWQKRTVGEVFEQALKRYYERKASKG